MEKLLVFCNNAIKVSSANPDKVRIAHSDGAGRPELTIAKFEYKIRYSPFKKKKKRQNPLSFMLKRHYRLSTLYRKIGDVDLFIIDFSLLLPFFQLHMASPSSPARPALMHAVFSCMLSQIITLASGCPWRLLLLKKLLIVGD